uniref:Vasculin-like protein 1 n=1 Tax=Capra hircus TaxID=9925 RepID=A0A452FJP6_CAPHI
MVQHNFVPAWLNFSTPQSAKSPTHLPQGDGRFGVSHSRHNSSDGFFNNGPHQTTGGSWHQPSLFHHDSMDSGVSKRVYHSAGGTESHRHWNGSFHSQKGCTFQEKPPTDIREEEKEDKVEKLQFKEEDFPSLNPEAGKQNQPCRPTGTPSGVWENPPHLSAAFSAVLTSPGSRHANGSKLSTIVPSVYKNLVPKPVPPPSKASTWKANRMKHKSGPLSYSRESAFSSPISVGKPVALAGDVVLSSPKESPTSTTPPIEISSSHQTKLTSLGDSEDDGNGDFSESRACDKSEGLEDDSTPEPKENGEESCHQNGLAFPIEEEGEVLSHSLEAEHRLLNAMGWQENSENNENCISLADDELREFHRKTEQLRRNTSGKNGFLQSQSSSLFSPWRSTCRTSSCETSDDDAWKQAYKMLTVKSDPVNSACVLRGYTEEIVLFLSLFLCYC